MAMTRSVSATAHVRVTGERRSGLVSQNYATQFFIAIARPRATPVLVFESVLALEYSELKRYFDVATSEELRAFRAHIGF